MATAKKTAKQEPIQLGVKPKTKRNLPAAAEATKWEKGRAATGGAVLKRSQKGVKPFYNRLTNEERRLLAEDANGLTPLQFLLSVMRDEAYDIPERIDAAKAAAPYIHRRMPIAIEGPTMPLGVMDIAALGRLSDPEIKHLQQLLAKAGGKLVDSTDDQQPVTLGGIA